MATTKKPYGSKAKEAKQRTASHAGFHFHNLYQCCQVKWATRYLFRITTKHTAVPLINGHAFHEGKATFYLTGSKKKALNKAISEIKSRMEEFDKQEDYLTILERCPTLLAAWIDKFGEADRKRFTFLAVEKEITLTLPGTDKVVTVRPDAVVQDKEDKDIYILETKTSSFSIRTTEIGVHFGDQATLYTWAVEQSMGLKIAGVIPDIAYWNKQSKNISNISCVRGDIVFRSETRQNQFIKGLTQLQSEIAQKVEAYKQGADPYMLFQRNTHYCNAFFKPCEFAEICNNNLQNIKRLPPGFKRDKARIKPKQADYVEDTCNGTY